MKKPIIGITLDLASNTVEKYSYSWRPWYAIRRDYSDIITKSGGIPFLLPYCADINELLNAIDGLLIPGGDEDINPKFYGQKITSKKVKINDERASFEINIVKEAIKRDMPVFGICNGLQVINVVMGGTLIQHIPDGHQSTINHEQPAPKHIPTHPIIIKDGTLLSKLSKSNNVQVNTTHHQALDKVGVGLNVSAEAPDGIIEAVESTNHRFLVGVQWHSEYQNTELDAQLFKRFVEESAKPV
jgi:putative glutamine amidotransferase